MGVTLEQAGDPLKFLDGQIGDPRGEMAITVKDVLSMESATTPCQLHKMLCPTTTNIEASGPSILRSERYKKMSALPYIHAGCKLECVEIS